LQYGDRAAVQEVFEGLSEESRRLRYHGSKPRLQEAEVDQLIDVGCCGREAVAAIDLVSGKVVGMARFVRDVRDPRVAEVAFEVVDACQSNGIGRRLIAELATLARLEGIECFRASVLVGNEAALALLGRAGRVASSEYVDGAYEIVVDLGSLSRAA